MAETDRSGSPVEDYEPGVLPVLQSRAETKAFYDKIAHVYDLLSERTEQPMRDSGLRKLGAAAGERILEIGFGTGHSLLEVAIAVGDTGRVFGLDVSPKMLEIAEKRIRDAGFADRVGLTCGDALRLPYPSESLDGIFMSFTLELFDTPEIPEVLAACKRALKPGGRLSVVAISKNGRQDLVLKAFEWTHRHFPNLMDCRPIYVEPALQASGFEVRDAEVKHMWVPVEMVLGVKPQ